MPKRNPSSSHPGRPIPFEVALEVASDAISKARANGGHAAVAGGLAMQLHGFDRNTKDVDIISTVSVRLPNRVRNITFGGTIFEINHPWGVVPLDVIVRNDDQQRLYEEAAEHATRIHGIPVISANYLALIKLLAARPKDELDFNFLVIHTGISVSRITKIIRTLFPDGAFFFIQELEQAVSLAEWQAKNERHK